MFAYLLDQDSLHRHPFCNELLLLGLSLHVHFVSADLHHLRPTPSDSQDGPRMLLCARLYNLLIELTLLVLHVESRYNFSSFALLNLSQERKFDQT